VLEKVTGDETLDHNPPFDNVQQPAEEVKKNKLRDKQKNEVAVVTMQGEMGLGGQGRAPVT
jgi:hypothetical protein